MGLVPGPHTSTPRAPKTQQQAPAACPKDGHPGEAGGLTPDPLTTAIGTPPWQPPAVFAACNSEHGVASQRASAASPRLRIRTRNKRGQRTQTACCKDRDSGKNERLTPDAPPGGPERHLLGMPSCQPQSAQHQLRRGCAVGSVPAAHTRTPTPRRDGQRSPATCPKGRQTGEGERLTRDAPHNGKRCPPPDNPLSPLRHTSPSTE